MSECKKVGVVTVKLCPVCSKAEKPEIQDCITDWIPRKPIRPVRCPRCKSPYWDPRDCGE